MKYHIELTGRVTGVQLADLSDDEKNDLLGQDLDEIYEDFIENEKGWEFYLERQYLTRSTDRFELTVKDADDKVVCDINNVNDLLNKDNSYKKGPDGHDLYDEDDEPVMIDGWSFEGVEDGCYLVRKEWIKGYVVEGDIDLEEPFDESRLYVVMDTRLNDEIGDGEDLYPANIIYYQRGNEPNLDIDRVELEYVSDLGAGFYETSIMTVDGLDCWESIDVEDEDEDD